MTKTIQCIAAYVVMSLGLLAPVFGQQVTVVNMIPNSLSGETQRDAEPNLAVNPAHPNQIMASAFTPDPMGTSNLPLFVSTNGGHTWSLTTPAIIPGTPTPHCVFYRPCCPAGVCDITLRFAGSSDRLYVSDLNPIGGVPQLEVWQLINPTSASVSISSLEVRPGASFHVIADQPYIEAATDAGSGHDHVMVAVNDLMKPAGRTATIDHTADATPPAPAGFLSTVVEAHATTGQDGPPVRLAIHSSGVIYGLFYGYRSSGREVIVVRDDSWGGGATPFQALEGSDGKPGVSVVSGLSVSEELGTQRLGSQLAIAVGPTDRQTVFVVYAEGTSSTQTLHVRKSTTGGATWIPNDLTSVSSATNPGIAVNSLGQIGFMYQRLVGSNWETHFVRSSDGGSTWPVDELLANVPDASGPYHGPNPIGDYLSLAAEDKAFYGIFSANNTPDKANFYSGTVFQREHDFGTKTLLDLAYNAVPVSVSIDPFFVKVEPGLCESHPELCQSSPALSICRTKPWLCHVNYSPSWWREECPACRISILVNPGDEYTKFVMFDMHGNKVGEPRRLREPIVENGVTYTFHISLKPTERAGYVFRAEVADGQKPTGPFNPIYTVRQTDEQGRTNR